MAVIEIAKIQVRRGQENQTGIPQLDSGEFGWAEDTENLYIGKRIVDGAVDDNNTRILTENDLNFFATLAQNTGTINSYYQYRVDNQYLTHTTGSTVQVKLDHISPSLADFGVVPSSTATDITGLFQYAINDLFNNEDTPGYDSIQQADLRRTLTIPAGKYILSGTVTLPPYTRIIGEGPGITTLIHLSTQTNMFKTIDAIGNDFENTMSSIGEQRAKSVYIEGMTIEYSSDALSDYALVSLDNVENATVRDVHFRTTSTSTTMGCGIRIRGTGDGIAGDVNLCENIHIERCSFENLNTAVLTTGSVVRATIENSAFNNLTYGVVFDTTATTPAPSDCIISQNRFQNIEKEGILVNGSVRPTNHISSYNSFFQVGNGADRTDFATTTTDKTPVISFYSSGNRTVGDLFNRKSVADSTSSTTLVYNPLVLGSTVINDTRTYNVTLAAGASNVEVAKIPLNGRDQMLRVNYQITSTSLSRKGNLLVNIGTDGFTTFSDYYNYSEYVATTGTSFTVTQYLPDQLGDIAPSSVNRLVIEQTYADSYGPFGSVTPVNYSIVGANNSYGGFSAVITDITVQTFSTMTYYVILTESSNPAFDFSDITLPNNEFQLAFSDFTTSRELTNFDFPLTTSTIVRNFVEMKLTNPSPAQPLNLEYQIDTQL